jgi:hypothetical protein
VAAYNGIALAWLLGFIYRRLGVRYQAPAALIVRRIFVNVAIGLYTPPVGTLR